MEINRVNYKTPRSKDKVLLNSTQTYTPSSNRDFNIRNFIHNVPASNNISSDVNYLSLCDDEKINFPCDENNISNITNYQLSPISELQFDETLFENLDSNTIDKGK
jgi:hypothetical protein